jgi:hypothetical protein
VIAGHQFTDVPNSNPFHNDIDALADANVTSGCGGGKFCPKDFVTREQMAAFLNRLGALAADKTPVVNAATVDGASVLGAVVESNGSLVSGVHALGATRLSTGRYVVQFDRTLIGCIRVATPGRPGNGTDGAVILSTEVASSDPTNRSAFLATLDHETFAAEDKAFHLMILCPG